MFSPRPLINLILRIPSPPQTENEDEEEEEEAGDQDLNVYLKPINQLVKKNNFVPRKYLLYAPNFAQVTEEIRIPVRASYTLLIMFFVAWNLVTFRSSVPIFIFISPPIF